MRKEMTQWVEKYVTPLEVRDAHGYNAASRTSAESGNDEYLITAGNFEIANN
jgi:hypothetical protein